MIERFTLCIRDILIPFRYTNNNKRCQASFNNYIMAEGNRSDMIYLNNAAMARLHPDVQQVGIRAITDQMSCTPDQEAATVLAIREHFAALVDANGPKDISLMPSTGFAITLAAKNIESQLLLILANQQQQPLSSSSSVESGKILLLQDQMCSAVYPWQDVCDRSNGKFALDIVPYPNPESSWTSDILARLQSDMRIVAVCLPPLHWSDGALIDLATIGEACRRRRSSKDSPSIPLIVDATQAVGAMSVSVKLIQPALLACSSHKWLRGPSGVSLVYIDPQFHDKWSPLDQHGRGRDLGEGTRDASKDEMGPNGYPNKFFNDARKFDSGGRPNPILLPMLRASLEHVVAIDKSMLQQTLKEKLQPFIDWVSSSDEFILPKNHAYHLMGIRPSPDNRLTPNQMSDICSQLQKDKYIYVAIRCGALRVSPYVDTSNNDVLSLVQALNEVFRF